MNADEMRLKAKINNYAKQNRIAPQVVLQNYMFERLLARLAVSPYQDRFLLKGGLLVATMVGLALRSTLDMDVTVRKLPLEEETISRVLQDVTQIDLRDGVRFTLVSVKNTRADDPYGGFCLRLDATYGSMVTHLSMDVTVGDAVTSARQYDFRGLFDDALSFRIWGYGPETILAEKIETILRRGIYNTRAKDFYDVCALERECSDLNLLHKALQATAEHRGSASLLSQKNAILASIATDVQMEKMWKLYAAKYPYASHLTFADCMEVLTRLLS